MEIQLKDLRVGDEIIVPSQSLLRYWKILRPIQESKKRKHWDPNKVLYKSVKCSTNRETITHKETRWGKDYTWNQYVYHCTPDNHNHEMLVDLNGKSIWLVNRK